MHLGYLSLFEAVVSTDYFADVDYPISVRVTIDAPRHGSRRSTSRYLYYDGDRATFAWPLDFYVIGDWYRGTYYVEVEAAPGVFGWSETVAYGSFTIW